jgi:stage III sporulation protein AB
MGQAVVYLKLAGAALILVSGFLAGRVGSRAWRQRERQLSDLSWAMEALATEMNCLLIPLPQIMGKLAGRLKGPVGELFGQAGEAMDSGRGISAQEAWAEAMDKTGSRLCLLEEDLALLSSAGSYLGASELADQLKRLEAMSAQLEAQRQKALEAIEREGKLVGFAWPAVALVVVILFW